MLKVWVNNPDGLSEIHIQASVDLGTNWTTLLEINSADNNIWKCHAIDLSNYRNADFLQIGILGATEDWGAESIMIDNLRIFDQLANDLVLNGFTGPESVIGAKPADYSVKIYNDGTNEATDYKVCIYSGDKLIAEQNGKPIRPDAYETFDFVLSSPVNSTVFDLTAKIDDPNIPPSTTSVPKITTTRYRSHGADPLYPVSQIPLPTTSKVTKSGVSAELTTVIVPELSETTRCTTTMAKRRPR